jgi:hypothetical protein
MTKSPTGIRLILLLMGLGCGQGAFDRPAPAQAASYAALVDAGSLGPHDDRQSLAAPFQQVIRSSDRAVALALISRLRAGRCPAAIAGGIRSVVVDAIECSSLGPRPHVGQEAREAASPRVAHGDAATAVVDERFITGVVTPIFSGRPSHVLGRARGTVRAPLSAGYLAAQAAAASCRSVHQAGADHVARLTAVASTEPSWMPIVDTPSSLTHDQQPAEAPADQIAERRHV